MNKMSWLFVLMAGASPAISQKVAAIDVALPVISQGLDVPVTIELNKYSPVSPDDLVLKEIRENEAAEIPFQPGNSGTITWLIRGASQANYHYELHKGKPAATPKITLQQENGSLLASTGSRSLLGYQFGTLYPPAGIDTNYRRSGFIHPLRTLNGKVLTRIQPPDHYHHYGIWNPWTHTLFENDTVDFWNIKAGQGTVRFAKFTSIVDGPVYAEFEALHEHVVFQKDGNVTKEKVALEERQTIRIYRPEEKSDHYIIDFTSVMQCATNSPLLIMAYRYGGLGWRATEEWDKNNCEVLTSEGTTRKNTDGSKARWCNVQGKLQDDYGGMTLMSYPANYNHPEPLRIWDANANGGRGDMFTNFAPTKDKDWLLEPGKTYVLKYRLMVFNGKMDAERAESGWQYFAKPVEVHGFHAKR